MKTKIFLFFVSFFLCVCLVSAQSLYLFKYSYVEDGKVEPYEAFLVRYDDGTGFMRVKFTNEGQDALVELKISERYGDNEDNNEPDSAVLVIESDSVVSVIGKNDDFSPDNFVFELNEQTGYFEPSYVAYFEDDKRYEGKFSDAELLTEDDLTEQLVLQFFTKDDEFYQNLFEEASVRSLPPAEKETKMFLLIVANTEDEDIGTSCVKDKDRTLKTFTDLAEFMQIKFSPQVIFGKDYSKQNVDKAIQAIQPSPNDIVVFYYTGHGFSKPDNRQFPYMALTSKSFESLDANSINIEDVYSRLTAKGARLNLIFSDCCNADPNASNVDIGDIAVTKSSGLGWDLDNCRSLFLNKQRMSILMTAASKGELSAGTGNLGGIFTYKFRTAMVNYFGKKGKLDQVVSWQNILFDAKNETIKKAENTKCKDPNNGSLSQCVQHPVFQIR